MNIRMWVLLLPSVWMPLSASGAGGVRSIPVGDRRRARLLAGHGPGDGGPRRGCGRRLGRGVRSGLD